MTRPRPVGRLQAYLALDVVDRMTGRTLLPSTSEWELKAQAISLLRRALTDGVALDPTPIDQISESFSAMQSPADVRQAMSDAFLGAASGRGQTTKGEASE